MILYRNQPSSSRFSFSFQLKLEAFLTRLNNDFIDARRFSSYVPKQELYTSAWLLKVIPACTICCVICSRSFPSNTVEQHQSQPLHTYLTTTFLLQYSIRPGSSTKGLKPLLLPSESNASSSFLLWSKIYYPAQ